MTGRGGNKILSWHKGQYDRIKIGVRSAGLYPDFVLHDEIL